MANGSEIKELGSDGNNSDTLSKNGQPLTPVVGGASGEGLPYAPQDWPNVGDKWKWKVGWRKSKSGYWLDRYLYLPDCLVGHQAKKRSFKSKHTVKTYLEKEFPDADVDAFFASFSWKIPCANGPETTKVNNSQEIVPVSEDLDPTSEVTGHEIVSMSEDSDPTFEAMTCNAKNRMCNIHDQTRDSTLEAMECNICCKEVGFCRDCCCILCFKAVDWVHGGYSFIRCEAKVNEIHICGHVAHISCALRCYMAGTVGGNIGLDAEYYCRRCDNKSDLIGHVTRSLKTCESLESRDELMKILNIGLCILRGSRRITAKNVRNQIELILSKLKSGEDLEEIWRRKDQISTDSEGDTSLPLRNNGGALLGELDVTRGDDSLQLASGLRGDQIPDYLTTDHRIQPLQLENEIDRVLHLLKNSQESEYSLAERKLYAHKDFVLSLCEQLDSTRPEHAKHTSSPNHFNSDPLPANVSGLVDQIKREASKLQQMMKIGKGFGRTSKSILKEHFDLHIEE